MHTYTGCLLVLAALAVPSGAFARTAAEVTWVAAELDLRAPDEARVQLSLRLEVRSGPLGTFEVSGLDPDLAELEVEVPEGIAPPVTTQQAPGQVRLLWPDRKTAPAPGELALRIAYRTRSLVATPVDGAVRRVSWTLPRWPERLASVQIRVIGPPGVAPLPPAQPNLGVVVKRDAHPPSLTFTRVELPRTEAWRVRVELPATTSELDTLEAVPEGRLGDTLDQSAWPCLLGVCLGVLVVAKRRLRRRDAPDTALVPHLEAPRFDALAFALSVLSAVLFQEAPSFSLACALAGIASGLERRDPSLMAAAADSGELPRRVELGAFLDATRLAGAALLAALYVVGFFTPDPARSAALTCLWLATPLFFSRTRLHTLRTRHIDACDQPTFLRRSSTIASRSLSSRPTASGAGS